MDGMDEPSPPPSFPPPIRHSCLSIRHSCESRSPRRGVDGMGKPTSVFPAPNSSLLPLNSSLLRKQEPTGGRGRDGRTLPPVIPAPNSSLLPLNSSLLRKQEPMAGRGRDGRTLPSVIPAPNSSLLPLNSSLLRKQEPTAGRGRDGQTHPRHSREKPALVLRHGGRNPEAHDSWTMDLRHAL